MPTFAFIASIASIALIAFITFSTTLSDPTGVQTSLGPASFPIEENLENQHFQPKYPICSCGPFSLAMHNILGTKFDEDTFIVGLVCGQSPRTSGCTLAPLELKNLNVVIWHRCISET